MSLELTKEEKFKKVLYEIADMASGAAFPFMLMLILSASVISFSSYDGGLPLQIVILVFGELLLSAAFVIFGRYNGITACKKSVANARKVQAGASDIRARLRVGEYSLYKGFVIGFITCVPFIIFQLIQCLAPNDLCEFVLLYAFGWAVYPFKLAELSSWLNFIWIIPLCCVHAAAYFWGSRIENKKIRKADEMQNFKDEK